MNLELLLEFEWSAVLCADGKPYSYPKPVRDVQGRFHGPAVYRWRFMEGETIAAVFFGECDDLIKEINSSVNPASGKSSRIKAALGERKLLGQAGSVDVLQVRSLSIGGGAITNPLRDKNIRRAIESLLIHEAAIGDAELLNQETSARDLLSLL